MANLATNADVAVSLLRELTIFEGVIAPSLLARASRAVRVYTGQYIEEVEHDEVVITSDLYGNFRLPQIPVTAIESIVVAGTELAPTDYEFDVHGHITTPTGDGFEINAVGGWYGPLTVTYTHGYEDIPDDIVEIVADVVAGRLSAAAASTTGGTVKRAEVDDVTVEYDTSATAQLGTDGLTDDHRAVLDKYKQPARPINMISRRVP